MSSGLMFDDIIMGTIKRNVLSHHTAEMDCVFTQIVSHFIYIYRGSLQDLYWIKGTYECPEIPFEHFCLKKNKVKDDWTRVLKNDIGVKLKLRQVSKKGRRPISTLEYLWGTDSTWLCGDIVLTWPLPFLNFFDWLCFRGTEATCPTGLQLHDALHGFREGCVTGTATLEAKLLQQLADMREEVLYVIFLDLTKAYDALDRSRSLDILKG